MSRLRALIHGLERRHRLPASRLPALIHDLSIAIGCQQALPLPCVPRPALRLARWLRKAPQMLPLTHPPARPTAAYPPTRHDAHPPTHPPTPLQHPGSRQPHRMPRAALRGSVRDVLCGNWVHVPAARAGKLLCFNCDQPTLGSWRRFYVVQCRAGFGRELLGPCASSPCRRVWNAEMLGKRRYWAQVCMRLGAALPIM